MKSITVNFVNKQGLRIAACLDRPDSGIVKTYAVFAHCFTCTKDLKMITNINRSLTDNGFGVLRFDFSGIGDSEGEFEDTNYSEYLDDILSSVEFLGSYYKYPAVMIGHSLGGCVVLETARNIPSLKAVVTIGTPAEPSNLSVRLHRTRQKAIQAGRSETVIGGVKFRFKKEFFEDLEKHHLKSFISQLGIPLLVLQSPEDTYTVFNNGLLIFNSANFPKSFVSMDGMDHLMLRKEDAAYTGKLIASWVARYI